MTRSNYRDQLPVVAVTVPHKTMPSVLKVLSNGHLREVLSDASRTTLARAKKLLPDGVGIGSEMNDPGYVGCVDRWWRADPAGAVRLAVTVAEPEEG